MALINDQMQNQIRHEAEVARLEHEAAKRFWRLVPEDATRGRFMLEDAVGRRIYGPEYLPQLRGYFAGLPPQA